MRTGTYSKTLKTIGRQVTHSRANHVLGPAAHTAGSGNVIFFFMSRSTSSRSWKHIMTLARFKDRLATSNTTVLIVGDGRYIEPARRLVKELKLPFRYVADNGALRRYFRVDSHRRVGRSWAMVLVDQAGVRRYCEYGSCHHRNPDLRHILAATEMVNDGLQPEDVCGSKVTRCERSPALVPLCR